MEIIEVNERMDDALFDGVQIIHQAVFDGTTLAREKLLRQQFYGLVAVVDGEVAGFKFGYEHDDGVFYSWLGGVHPDFQQRGIAQALMKAQHAWCKAKGYVRVRTYGRNVKRAMLIVNIKAGFDIVSTFVDEKGRHKIIFEKAL